MPSELITPRQAAGLVGVSESTIRRWCDADVLTTTKTTGGHRRISKQVLFEYARAQGLELQAVAQLATIGKGGRLANAAELSSRLYEQLLNGDENDVQQFIQGLVERTGDAAGLCDEVLAPAMHRIGDSWARDEVRIFREHAATQKALSALSLTRSRLSIRHADPPLAVCAALPGDPYALPPAMCSLVMRTAGFRTTLLGPGTPPNEIVQAATELSAAVVTVSVSTVPSSSSTLTELCKALDELGSGVALGGRMLSSELRRALRPDFFGDTMGHLFGYAEKLIGTLRNKQEGSRA